MAEPTVVQTLRAALQRALQRAAVQDVVVAAVVASLSVVALWTPPPFVDVDFRDPDTAGVVLALLSSGAVAFRSSHPVAATIVALAAAAPLTGLGYSQGIGGLAALLALYSVAVSRPLRTSLTLLAVTISTVGAVLVTGPLEPTLSDWFMNAFVIGAAWAFGRSVRAHRMHLTTLTERNRAESEARSAATRAMVVEERAGVARDMQDLVAHALTEINVEVAAARRTLSRGDITAAEGLLLDVEQTGRTAMEELRRAVDVLGRSDSDAAMRPQPGLADLADLLDRERSLGGDVADVSTVTAVAVPAGVALTSYRVVEEVLAGARRDGPTHADVAVDWAPDALTVRVRTTPRTPRVHWSDESPGSGSGLEALRHRVEVYGGELRWARTRDGGAAVTARFPHRWTGRAR